MKRRNTEEHLEGGLHKESTDNGQRLVDFASSSNIIISSTCFLHHNIHKRKWVSPDRQTFNQINHILIDKRAASGILDVHSFMGANCDTDHYLVKAKFRSYIASCGQTVYSVTQLFNIKKLKDECIAILYTEA